MASLRCPTCKQLIHSETIIDNEVLCCPYCSQRIIIPPFKDEPVGYPLGAPIVGISSEPEKKRIPKSKQNVMGKSEDAFSRKVRFINRQGNFLFRDTFSDAQDYHEGLAGFAQVAGIETSYCPLEWGFLNDRGEIVIASRYTDVLPFSEGFAAVRDDDGKWGFVDFFGELVIPARFKEAFSFREGWALVKIQEEKKSADSFDSYSWDFIDSMGRRLSELGKSKHCFQEARVFKQTLAAVKIDKKWGFINRRGKVIIPCEYERVMDFEKGFAAIEYRRTQRSRGLWGFIDLQGKSRIPPQYEEVGAFSEGLVLVKTDGLWGYSDADGSIQIPPTFQDASPFFQERAIVVKNGKCGLIKKNGDFLLPAVYDSVSQFKENRAIVSAGGKCGVIDPSGRVIVPFKFDIIGEFSEGLAPAQKDDRWGFIDRHGEIVVPIKFSRAYGFVNGFARVEE